MESLSTDPNEYSVYSQPEEVGCFSLSSGKVFINDKRNLKYYKEPDDKQKFWSDLKKGYPDKFVDWDPEEKRDELYSILEWTKKANPRSVPKVDFVTRRGILAKVMRTPYDQDCGWTMEVTKDKDTWYIRNFHEKKKNEREGWKKDTIKRNNYMGHKFEQCLTSDYRGGQPDPDAVVDLNKAFYTVVTSKLKSHSLLFSAEVDARVTYKDELPPTCYVEMKTLQRLRPKKDSDYIEIYCRNWLKCWVQSYLVGVQNIAIGFRGEKGPTTNDVVTSVEHWYRDDILGEVAQYNSDLDAFVCINFCDKFLSYVKSRATEEGVVYLFTREKGGTNVTCKTGQT